MWVSRFKYRIKLAPNRFELGATPCPTHVGGHLDQLWNSNKSYLSISLRVQDTFLKWAGLKKNRFYRFDCIFEAQKHDCNKKRIWLPGGNTSISQETIPQENPVFKPAHPQMHTAPYCVVSKLLQTALFCSKLGGRESRWRITCNYSAATIIRASSASQHWVEWKKLLLTITRSGYLQSKSYHYVAYWSFLNLNLIKHTPCAQWVAWDWRSNQGTDTVPHRDFQSGTRHVSDGRTTIRGWTNEETSLTKRRRKTAQY